MDGKKRWSQLSPGQRGAIIGTAAVQFTLAGFAWWDLSRRPAAAVRGPKLAWAIAIAVNFIGPLAYLRFGRKPLPEIDA
ncbi:PLD nuclease N-terminal domain-containing protein [Amycolatopsis sp. GM8]|uniref:PLD nuclease N-terminal domain-containing protein n=1 Tax=Amycolatopsis sp. GM8 TaxID=2896530 RepID=UPI001F30B247|nr:PLD nuclease N-terminal domain-containing protein [Amycolatopsis sp. GM8]